MTRLLYGPFEQLLTMSRLPEGGPIADSQLELIPQAGIAVQEGKIAAIGPFSELRPTAIQVHELEGSFVALPGFIDAHTHLCFAGDRALDYTRRLNGETYEEIAAQGGGILETVRKTRAASEEHLIALLLRRLDLMRREGVTTCEIKSGYGLSVMEELKMLNAIAAAASLQTVSLIPTCLAAHTCPPEFKSASDYLNALITDLLPLLKRSRLASRIDIFIEAGAFSPAQGKRYLLAAKEVGFQLTVHADQFTRGGAALAAQVGAASADHLEASTSEEWGQLKAARVVPVVLPGATLGLGLPFAPARGILDAGLPLAIASDWNPGSAPMGSLVTQAALLGMNQKLTQAETLAALTVRAARALRLLDRGALIPGARADCLFFACKDYREILYYQGGLKPSGHLIAGRYLDFLA